MTSPDPLPSPLASIGGGAFSWSLGIPLVTDGQGVRATATDPTTGIWGVAPFHALLVAAGDLSALEDALEIGTFDGTGLVAGPQWVELFVDADTPISLVGSIVTTSQEIEMTAADGALPVEPLDPDGYHDDLLVFASGSAPLGGLTIPDCEN